MVGLSDQAQRTMKFHMPVMVGSPGSGGARPEASGAIFQAVDGSPHLETSHMPAPRVPTLRKVHNRTWSSRGDISGGVGDQFQPSERLHFARDRQDCREPGDHVRFRPVTGSGAPEPDGTASSARPVAWSCDPALTAARKFDEPNVPRGNRSNRQCNDGSIRIASI